MNYVLNAEPDSFAAEFARKPWTVRLRHGFSREADASDAFRRALAKGAKPVPTHWADGAQYSRDRGASAAR